MRFVALLAAGANAKPGAIYEQDPAILHAHLVHMRRHYEGGTILFGGPFRSRFGGLVLMEAGDLTQARAVVSTDPAVEAGIMVQDVHGVRPYFDAFSGQAWTHALSR